MDWANKDEPVANFELSFVVVRLFGRSLFVVCSVDWLSLSYVVVSVLAFVVASVLAFVVVSVSWRGLACRAVPWRAVP